MLLLRSIQLFQHLPRKFNEEISKSVCNSIVSIDHLVGCTRIKYLLQDMELFVAETIVRGGIMTVSVLSTAYMIANK